MSNPTGFNAIPGIIQNSQDKLNEAITIAHQCGDKIDEARNIFKMLVGVLDPNKLQPLLTLFDTLEVNAHNQLVAQIRAMQAALEQSK